MTDSGGAGSGSPDGTPPRPVPISPATLATGRRPASPPPSPAAFGRVDADGTVFVRTDSGEREVGQVPDVRPDEALQFFVRRYSALELEVSLLERRISGGTLSADEATAAVATVRQSVSDAHAVGDLDGLLARLDGLAEVIRSQRAAARAERTQATQESRAAKERFVAEAEQLAAGNDWRGGVNRFRSLLEEWKQLPRLDRATDDALWHRFSSARTTYTRRRKAQFASQAQQRDAARIAKEQILAEAEALAGSTDWAGTTVAMRDLMTRWKAAGSAPREVDEALWKGFRSAQDGFFAAKQAAFGQQEAEYTANARAKEALLAEAEALLPVRDAGPARAVYRSVLERWAAVGRVPRDLVKPYENRLRKLEEAIKAAEDDRWHRSNPETRARAEDTAAKLEAQIAALEDRAQRARDRGDSRAAEDAERSAATYREWLEQARRAVSDFGG